MPPSNKVLFLIALEIFWTHLWRLLKHLLILDFNDGHYEKIVFKMFSVFLSESNDTFILFPGIQVVS